MIHLLRKNSGFFLFYWAVYFGIAFPFINYDRVSASRPIDLSFVLYITFYIYWLVLGSIYSHEQLEHKNSGYAFLGILPIAKRDIVLSKYILVFLTILIYGVVHFFWLGFIFDNPAKTATARSFLIVNAGICLVLSGWYYALIFRFGFAKFGKVLLISWLLFLIGPLAALIFVLPKTGLTREDIIHFFTKTDPLAAVTMAIIIYSAGFLASLRFFNRERT